MKLTSHFSDVSSKFDCYRGKQRTPYTVTADREKKKKKKKKKKKPSNGHDTSSTTTLHLYYTDIKPLIWPEFSASGRSKTRSQVFFFFLYITIRVTWCIHNWRESVTNELNFFLRFLTALLLLLDCSSHEQSCQSSSSSREIGSCTFLNYCIVVPKWKKEREKSEKKNIVPSCLALEQNEQRSLSTEQK